VEAQDEKNWFAVFALLILALCAMPSPAQADQPDKIDPEKYAVGAKLAKGIRKAEGCEFSQLSFKTKEGVWASYKVNDTCELILDARWRGKDSDAPDRFQSVLSASDSGGSEEGDTEPTTVESWCTLHKQAVYTWGGGGPEYDKLTRVRGWLKVCRQPPYSGFTSASHGRKCWGATLPFWYWSIDVCKKYGLTFTSNEASGTQQGNFHCQATGYPNPCGLSGGYYHNLYLTEYAYSYGPTYCYYFYSGNVVIGPSQSILSGCQVN